MKRLSRRPLTILEVLIAFALVVLCVFPLIAPHVLMLRAEYRFIDQVKLDHFINNHYVSVLQQLHRNEISWTEIEEGRQWTLEAEGVKPFAGGYSLSIEDHKPKKAAAVKGYLLKLEYRFTEESLKKPLVYTYFIYAVRQLSEEADDEETE